MPPESGADIAELYRLHRDEVCRYLVRLTGNLDAAEELVQDAFLAALRYIHTFDPRKGEFRPWLFTIARNAFHRRARKGRGETELEAPEEQPDTRSLPQSGVDTQVVSHQIRAIVERLPEPERSIIRLKYFEQITMKECADRLGLSLSTCARRLTDAIKLLRQECQMQGITLEA